MLLLCLIPPSPLRAQGPPEGKAVNGALATGRGDGYQVWAGSWAASQQLPEPDVAIPADDLRDATLRQIVHLSISGPVLRIHLSNVFGAQALHLASVHIARAVSPSSAQIDPATDKALTFSGSPDITIPPGAEYLSDPLAFPVPPLSDLAVTIHFDEPPLGQTGHNGSRATSYLVRGNKLSAAEMLEAKKIDHWYFLSAVDVSTMLGAASVVVLGDSITDGHGVAANANTRWTDTLAQRLQANAATRNIGVLNQGIGGNHLLTNGLGPDALSRFDRDVLAQTGVRWVILLEGVNDIGGLTRLSDPAKAEHAAFVRRVIGAYEQMIARAHAARLSIIGATIMPYTDSEYYHPPASNEADRQAINAWIRAAGHFDAVIDFDKAMADPARPDHLAPAYDSGDHLHPSTAGYRAMGELVPLSLFAH